MSVAVTWSPFFAAGYSHGRTSIDIHPLSLDGHGRAAFRFMVVCASTFVSAVLFTSTLFALQANFALWCLDDDILVPT